MEEGAPVQHIANTAVPAITADSIDVNIKLPAVAVQEMFLLCVGAIDIVHGHQAPMTPGEGQLPLASRFQLICKLLESIQTILMHICFPVIKKVNISFQFLGTHPSHEDNWVRMDISLKQLLKEWA